MAFQTSFRRQQRNDSQAAFQLSDPQITCLWEEVEEKNEYAMREKELYSIHEPLIT